mmetsp:Transcript_109303/g.308431  ORF Transcript_109303/g.308431 Transcript_109303/m.308431 type:complete len:206 (-) Transcript_109303:1501-2118(-)
MGEQSVLRPVSLREPITSDVKRLFDGPPLDVLVERRVGAEAGEAVHLDEPRRVLSVQHDVETKQLEGPATHAVATKVLRESAVVFHVDPRLRDQDCLNNEVAHILPKAVCTLLPVMLFKVREEPTQRPFAARTVIVSTLVELEVVAAFIHCVVGEVHPALALVISSGRFVGDRAQADEPVAEKENAEIQTAGLAIQHRANEHINT